jgi:two-component SAPR family response regulator
MKEHFNHLLSLINSLPEFDSSRSYSQLNSILSEYTKTLNAVNSYNDNYKRDTNVYYNDISEIRDNIQTSLSASSPIQKNIAFNDARKALKSNIEALATLVKPQEEFAEAAI